jgi:GWxTD domain-containing protein
MSFALNIDVQSYVFKAEKSYLETYLRVDVSSIKYDNTDENAAARIEFLILIRRGEDVLHADKFILMGMAGDSLSDLLDIRRYYLSEGQYTLHLLAADMADGSNKTELEQTITVTSGENKILLSDVILLSVAKEDTISSPMVRNGIYMEPLNYSFTPESMEFMYFYCEVYNNEPIGSEEFYLQYSVSSTTSESLEKKTIFTKYKKLKNLRTEPILLPVSLKEIASGEYEFNVAVVDKQRNVVSMSKSGFIRSNPSADLALAESINTDFKYSYVHQIPDTELDYILKAHVPVAEQSQMAILGDVIKKANPRSQRHYIYQYWQKTVKENHEAAFRQYMEVAKVVDKQFYSNVGYGFQSDRGYIFLKYGRPNNVLTIDNEPDAPPYEIWYFNYIPSTQQTNVRFLFWNPSLVHNDFQLLHSNCYRERNNPQWEVDLYRSVPNERIGNSTDARQVGDNFNRQARRYFNDY